jgi:spore coat protein CotH
MSAGQRRTRRLVVTLAVLCLVAVGCSSTDASTSAASSAATSADEAPALFDETVVHEIMVSFDQEQYDAMIDTFAETGEKEYIEATVTIDGVTYERAGLRLKGNSSLAGLGGGPGGGFPGGDPQRQQPSSETTSGGPDRRASESASADAGDRSMRGRGGNGPDGVGPMGGATADEPEQLPWLIRLDEYVDGQDHQGYEDVVIRSNSTETALNDAVALDLLAEAGLPSQEAVHTGFSVNGGEPILRLAIEHPSDDAWSEEEFDAEGALYKAESTGDWSYRGDAQDAYTDVFDQESGDEVTDLTPLIDFLEFINESDDEAFAAELSERLDVESFAGYLAMMDLVDNADDIDGPGNNAYLWYDVETESFTVVPWDMNLAFGGLGNFGAGDFQPPEGAEIPDGFPTEGFEPPEGMQLPEGVNPEELQRQGGPLAGRSNPLVERFHEVDEFEALYQEALTELRTSLYGGDVAESILAERTDLLTAEATDLVDEATIRQEADAIAEQFTVEDEGGQQ